MLLDTILLRLFILIFTIGLYELCCNVRVGSTTSSVISTPNAAPRAKNVNPVFNQTLKFEVHDPYTEQLYIQFFDKDDYSSKEHTIGDVHIPLNHLKKGSEVVSARYLTVTIKDENHICN